MSYREQLELVRSINERYRHYQSLEALLELDRWTGLPPQAQDYQQRTAAFLAEQKAALYTGGQAESAAAYFRGVDLSVLGDGIERALVRSFLFRRRSYVNTPPQLARAWALGRAERRARWLEARQRRDAAVFLPSLEEAFQLKKEIALAIDPTAPPYQTLVGLWDEGLDVAEMDRAFAQLKQGLLELLPRLKKNGGMPRPGEELLTRQESPVRMAAFARRLARQVGFAETLGGFDHRAVHAFTAMVGPKDARVATGRDGSLKLVFTCLHEAGHAMYATGGSPEVDAAGLWGGVEGSFHEGMARFTENVVGRSRAFWRFYYPQLQEEFPAFRDLHEEDFYRALTAVRPGHNRMAADEVTYNLHILLRCELERAWFAGELTAQELPEAWNALSERYFGARPEDDREGILQDMHWAGDYIGYFQSYALGNLYSAQIYHSVRSEIPTLEAQLARGNFAPLNAWLDKRVRQYGRCFKASTLLQKATGSSLDTKHFLRYLEDKYAGDTPATL